MIQFNLLPDLKLKYIKAKRFKHTAMIISFVITASTLAIFIFMFMTVYVFQKNHISAVTTEINEAQDKINKTKDAIITTGVAPRWNQPRSFGGATGS